MSHQKETLVNPMIRQKCGSGGGKVIEVYTGRRESNRQKFRGLHVRVTFQKNTYINFILA